jgi:ketosteroid isomerase-like protein
VTDSPNVKLVRSIYAPEERGDFSGSSPVDWAHPEIEHVTVEGVDAGSVTGQSGLTQAVRNWLSDFDDVRLEAEDYCELDGDRVLVLNKLSGRAKRSGLHVDQKGAEVFEIHDGRVTRIVQYVDRVRALADLGLEG